MSNRLAILLFSLLLLQISCTSNDYLHLDSPVVHSASFELQYDAAKEAMHESPQEAVSLLKEARQTALDKGDHVGVAKTWYLEGYVNDLYNRPGDAYKAFLESELAYSGLNDSVWMEKSLRYQAAILLRLPDTKRAWHVLDQAAQLVGDEQAQYRQYYLRGVAAYYEGRNNEASAIFDSVAISCKKFNDLDYLAQVHNYQGLIALEKNDYELASHQFLNSAYTSAESPLRKVVALNNMGLLLEDKGDLDSACHYYREALDMPLQTGSLRHHMVAAINLGELHLFLGRYKEAKAVIENSLTLNRHQQDPVQLEAAYSILIRSYENTGKMTEAMKLWHQLELLKNERNDLLNKQNKLEVQLAELTMEKRLQTQGRQVAHIPWMPYFQYVILILVFVGGLMLILQFYRQRKALREIQDSFKPIETSRQKSQKIEDRDLSSVV